MVCCFIYLPCEFHVSVAQLVEQLTLNQWVRSSILRGNTELTHNALIFSALFFFYYI